MIYQASYQGEATVKKLLFDLRGLSQRAKASKKHKNTIGRKIWEETQSMLDEICTPANGPHSYSLLDDLTWKFNLLAQPLYTFPSNSAQTRPDLPCVFLQEVVTLDPQAKTQWHLQTIIRPEYFFKNKFICQLCYQVTSFGSTHAYCPVRKRCFLCSRIKLNESDWYGFLMSKKFCPSNLVNHPAVNYLPDQTCPTCNKKLRYNAAWKFTKRTVLVGQIAKNAPSS